MALDGIFLIFLVPVMIGLAVLLVIAVRARVEPIGRGMLGLGWQRIASGCLGAMVALLLYAVMTAYQIGLNKVELGHIPSTELINRLPGWALYSFIIMTPVALILAIMAGLPMWLLLSRFRLNSMTGLAIIALLLALLLAMHTYRTPHNLWCQSNLHNCVWNSFTGSIIPAILFALGFGLGARLPKLVSPKNQLRN